MGVLTAAYVFVSFLSFRAIKRQADIAGRQAKSAEVAACAAKKSAEVAEHALKISQRADVLLNRVSLLNPFDATGIVPKTTVKMEFKNCGKTRAEKVVFHVKLTTPDLNDAEIPAIEPITMGAGETQVVGFPYFGQCFTRDTAVKV